MQGCMQGVQGGMQGGRLGGIPGLQGGLQGGMTKTPRMTKPKMEAAIKESLNPGAQDGMGILRDCRAPEGAPRGA